MPKTVVHDLEIHFYSDWGGNVDEIEPYAPALFEFTKDHFGYGDKEFMGFNNALKTTKTVVALENNTPVGFIAFSEPHSKHYELALAYTRQDKRERGVFTKMLECVETEIKNHGGGRIGIAVEQQNIRLVHFLQSRGFNLEGGRDPEKHWASAYKMWIDIAA